MSRHHQYPSGLGEDAGESTLFITTTPSGATTRQGGDITGSTDWGAVIQTALPALLNVYGQQQLTRLNVARINQGLSPITAREYVDVYRPPTAELQIGATAQTQRMLMFAGLGVLALVGLRAAKII